MENSNQIEPISYLSNINTKNKNIRIEDNNIKSKDIHEDILNYKLSLRKKETQNKLMKIRLKNANKNKSKTLSGRQKMNEYKKLFDINKIEETKYKLLDKNNNNYMKDKNVIELVYLYSQNVSSNENIQKIFDLKDNILINLFLKEIINNINSSTPIDLELFDYYLLILGNFFIFTKSIQETNEKECMNLFLNILNKNIALETYDNNNFDIINDTLWLIYLCIFFNNNEYLSHFAFIIQNIHILLSNQFFDILAKYYKQNDNKQLYMTIIKEIIYSELNIYSLIYEQIFENININNMPYIPNEIFQYSLDSLINLLNNNLVKNIYDENITNIIALIFCTQKNHKNITFSNNNFLDTFCSLFNKYKYDNYDNNKISQNLIIILNKIIDNYYSDEIFLDILKDSDILPICIQYHLKNGSLINMTLVTLNLLFKYQMNYSKIIIKCINYKLIENVSDILSTTESNEKNCYGCLNTLINSHYFLENNIKNPEYENIIKYFNINNGLISKLEQLLLSNNKDIKELSYELYHKLKNYNN